MRKGNKERKKRNNEDMELKIKESIIAVGIGNLIIQVPYLIIIYLFFYILVDIRFLLYFQHFFIQINLRLYRHYWLLHSFIHYIFQPEVSYNFHAFIRSLTHSKDLIVSGIFDQLSNV